MADTKITALAAIGANPINVATFPIPMVDLLDNSMAASGTTKKVTVNQILGAGGTATLASATITGDLTVDTSTLKVDSANNRVGIGTASPGFTLDILGASGVGVRIYESSTGNNNRLQITQEGTETRFNSTYASGSAFYTWQIAGSEQMRLNSTGLGVGMSPSAILSVLKSSATQATGLILRNGNGSDGSSISLDFETSSGTSGIEASLAGRISGRRAGAGTTGALDFFVTSAGTLGSAKMTIDASGNVGIGVTPKTWVTNRGGIEVAGKAAAFLALNGTGNVSEMFFNSYYDSTGPAYKYAYNGLGGRHEFGSAGWSWLIAPTNSSGAGATASTWTQAMTLDASGNLLVGTTNTSTTAGVGFKSLYSATTPSLSMVVNDSAGTGAAVTIYNTNAAAYRFYVSNSGTIFATNTTISAISDARLKENVQDLDVGLDAILALKPRKFDWKAGKGKDIKGDRGFIAQEFEQVFPNLIDEWKDAAPEGEAPYKSVRQDLIPVLVKAIQELTARVQTLEAK